MFWGVNLKEGHEYDLTNYEGKVLTMTGACMNPDSEESKSYIYISTGENQILIGALQKECTESINLGHTMLITDKMKIGVTRGSVCVTGFFEIEGLYSNKGIDNTNRVEKEEHYETITISSETDQALSLSLNNDSDHEISIEYDSYGSKWTENKRNSNY